VSKAENNFLRGVVPHLQPCFYRRIEDVAGVGTPDVFILIDGVAVWYEGKYARQLPAKPLTPVFGSLNHPLSSDQENWLMQYHLDGGICWIFARIIKDYVLVPGRLAFEFNKMTLSEFDPYRVRLDMLRYHLVTPTSLGSLDP